MMMYNKWRRVLLIAITLSLLATSCGSSSEETGDASDTGDDVVVVDDAADEEPEEEETGEAGTEAEEPAAETVAESGESVDDKDTAGGPPRGPSGLVAPAESCDPANPELQDLSELPGETFTSDINENAVAIQADVPAFGGTVRLTVHSQTEELARTYFDTTACFEIIAAEAPIDVDIGANASERALIDTILQFLIDDRHVEEALVKDPNAINELRAALNQLYADSDSNTLMEFIAYLGGDVDAIRSDSTDRAIAAIDSRDLPAGVIDVLLSEIEADLDDFLTLEPLPGVLDAVGDLRLSEQATVLADDGNRIIELEVIQADEIAEHYLAHYFIDPSLNQGKFDEYSWKRSRYVEAIAYVREGRIGIYLYRWDGSKPVYRGGTRRFATAWTKWLKASSSTNRWYRLRGFGWQNGSEYYLHGTWSAQAQDFS